MSSTAQLPSIEVMESNARVYARLQRVAKLPTYRQRLALRLGGKQYQRACKVWQ